MSSKDKSYYRRHREEICARSRAYRKAHPAWLRNSNLKRYGITIAEYERLRRKQGGKCAICGRRERQRDYRTKKRHRLAVDHDADTGKVRGLLCGGCNTGIGKFDHDRARLAEAIRYLRKATQ